MASECTVSIIAEVTGLGEGLQFLEKFAVTGTVLKAVLNRQIQAVAGTEEALNLCGISTVELVIIKATTNGLIIDADYTAPTFDASDHVPEGECRIIKPQGTNIIYIDGSNATKAVTVDVLIVGSA